MMVGESLLSIQKRTLPTVDESITLFIDRLRHESYHLSIKTEDLVGVQATLLDQFLDNETILEQGVVNYEFNVTTDAASRANDRFKLKFTTGTLSNGTSHDTGWRIFPNPVENQAFKITNGSIQGEQVSLQVVNSLGQQVLNEEFVFNGVERIQLNPQTSAGIYLVKLMVGNKSQTLRLVIE